MLETVVNDDEVSDFDDESEEDIPHMSTESDNNGDSSESETEFIENSDDSGKFVRVVYIWNQIFFIYKRCCFVFNLEIYLL